MVCSTLWFCRVQQSPLQLYLRLCPTFVAASYPEVGVSSPVSNKDEASCVERDLFDYLDEYATLRSSDSCDF